jgi:hypothetical protein
LPLEMRAIVVHDLAARLGDVGAAGGAVCVNPPTPRQ